MTIGFFDSGVGGLSVLSVAMKEVPGPMLYLGDTARMPYGVRPAQEVEQFALQCFDAIAKEKPDGLVIACNTATAVALTPAQQRYTFPVIGVIAPGCAEAVRQTRNKRIAVLATEAAVNSGRFQQTLRSLDPAVEVKAVGAPDLVVAIEQGHLDDVQAEEIWRRYLSAFGAFDFDTLILGCTHFPLGIPALKRVLGEASDVHIVDPAEGAVRAVRLAIEGLDDVAASAEGGRDLKHIRFFVTGDIDAFRSVAERVLDLDGWEVSFEKPLLDLSTL